MIFTFGVDQTNARNGDLFIDARALSDRRRDVAS